MITDWKNKKVAVLGMGVEGISSAKFLINKGARVTVLDRKKDIKKLRNKDIKIKTGENYLKDLDKFDVIVRSPGVKRNLPEIVAAEQNGILITSQTKIFFDVCPCLIIGITGTKGKGTTASLIYEMLKKEGFNVYLGGNIGKPPFEFLDKLNDRSWVVLELSSFQLQDLTKSPHIAVVLMITSEHLDYHKDTQEYVNAKRNILRFQKATDFAIINRDYPASHESDIHTEAKIFQVSRERECGEGCFVKDGKVVVPISSSLLLNDSSFARGPVAPSSHPMSSVSANGGSLRALDGTSTPVRQANSTFGLRSSSRATPRLDNAKAHRTADIVTEEIISIKDILLPGKHNLENVCASVMAATLAGVSKENIVKVLKTFKGLEHRLELTREINGVRYYDDSFSTTPETAIAAIEAFKNPEIIILGGSSKGSDFTELGRVINNSKNIKAIIGIGAEWKRIKAQFRIQNSEFRIIEGLRDMKSIVRKAASIAEAGDVVLLSPACASFDMFKNYKDRGFQFKHEVLKLKS